MPSRNVIRSFHKDGYYHVYNRGVAKTDVYLDEQDYKVFLYYLKVFLIEPELIDTEEPFYDFRRLTFSSEFNLLSYCLMPNHYHLYIRQQSEVAVSEIMRAISNAYTKYFNTKYDRVGPIFQGRFKAVEIIQDSHYTHLSRYIHQNPKELGVSIETYEYSSYKYFLDSTNAPEWLKHQEILANFNGVNDYKKFIDQPRIKSHVILSEAAIE